MEVKISIEELQELKNRVDELEKENIKLRDRADAANPRDIEIQIKKGAKKHLHKYLNAIFKSLGFDIPESSFYTPIECTDQYTRSIDEIDNFDNISVEVAADVSESFRKAYLNIGIIPNIKRFEWTDELTKEFNDKYILTGGYEGYGVSELKKRFINDKKYEMRLAP